LTVAPPPAAPVARPAARGLSSATAGYRPSADLRWLLRRPWLLVARLTTVLWQLGSLVLALLVQGNSSDAAVQRRLAQRILRTLTQLGPCFIKVGQALSTRPDLVRRDWLEQLTQLQDNLPPFPHAVALATIERELGAPANQLFVDFPDHPMAAATG
jgi:predicted unusual protein kinase regulating ubiquinone biosynthesis (AarF/ABC1/UbiB family)